MNGCPIEEYPVNKFTKHEKGFETDTFFQGRDSRTWMLDPEGYYIILEWLLCNHLRFSYCILCMCPARQRVRYWNSLVK